MSDFYYTQPGPIMPFALPGHTVAFWVSPSWRIYGVEKLEPIPVSQQFTFDAVALAVAAAITPAGPMAAGAQYANIQIVNLQPSATTDKTEAYQLRTFVLDDILVTVKMGQADIRFHTRALVARVDRFTAQKDRCGHSTEFSIVSTNTPFLDVQNASGYAIAQARICFHGIRYGLNDLDASYATTDMAREGEKKKGKVLTFVTSGGWV